MNDLIIATLVVLLLSLKFSGMNIAAITSIISTALFCSRKIGHFCKLNNLLIIEGIGIFLTVAVWLLFKGFMWKRFLALTLLRVIFLGICYYDIKNFVYVKEIHRKDN